MYKKKVYIWCLKYCKHAQDCTGTFRTYIYIYISNCISMYMQGMKECRSIYGLVKLYRALAM